MEQKHYNVLISGGGTGGHIFPALSIANALKRRDKLTNILFVGAEGRMEMERVPAAGYEIVGLPVSGFNRKNMLSNVKVLFKLMKSMMKAKRVLKDFEPDIAVGACPRCCRSRTPMRALPTSFLPRRPMQYAWPIRVWSVSFQPTR